MNKWIRSIWSQVQKTIDELLNLVDGFFFQSPIPETPDQYSATRISKTRDSLGKIFLITVSEFSVSRVLLFLEVKMRSFNPA
ncbi:hypothetical protein Mrub_0740 [Meiothermus ruber DSM 1279]|uniref:Uncharacterized protein n=1 Tax=Meiothermus ruber (strain ATCC 35948 / DSM 1279 / VKM B-1258 / 21) TaxID=504728 RepID=D3PP97_MEIRD|nr:hypothetical protein Mrub_0740 [Meiothermus ruber DSM 1279]AGK03970.1 hypothetical protein K649_03340 [Meiothermus ruber DSM 1279]